MLYEIYLITNLKNNKKYVGQTRSTIGYLNRFKQHVAEAYYRPELNSILHRAIRKYGPEAFQVKRLLHDIPESKIDFYEALWIEKLNTFKSPIGYNMTKGGQGIHGFKHSQETLKQLSLKSKTYWKDLKENNPERYKYLCNLRSINNLGKPKSKLARIHCSEAAKKRFVNQPGTFKGKKHKESSKRKVALANGRPVVMLDQNTLEPLRTFLTAMDATRYLIEIGATKNIYANALIFHACGDIKRNAYGFKWQYSDKV